MLLVCNKCGSHDEHSLDKEDNKVYCLNCGEELPDITNATKIVLSTQGQTRKSVKAGFQFKCGKCDKSDNPVLTGAGAGKTKATCRNCEAELDVPAPMIMVMKEMGQAYRK